MIIGREKKIPQSINLAADWTLEHQGTGKNVSWNENDQKRQYAHERLKGWITQKQPEMKGSVRGDAADSDGKIRWLLIGQSTENESMNFLVN